jgi:hypothetical protein
MYKSENGIKFFFLLSFFVVTATAGYTQLSLRQNTILESGFEGAGYLNGWSNLQHCCDYSVQQTAEKIKAGSNALRIELRRSDPQTSGSMRSEITIENDPFSPERWYGFSLYLKDWADDDAGEDVFQWHPGNDTGSASMALWTNGGRFTYVTNSGGDDAFNTYTDLGPVLSNQWVDFVVHIKWAGDTTGLLQVWMKGNLVINRSGVKTASDAPYFKLGINKFGWLIQETSTVTQRILYYDEVRVGNANATYNDVAPFLPKRDYFQGL